MTSKLITCSDDGTEVSSQRKKIRNKRHPYQKEVKLPLGFPGSSSIKNPPAMQETQEIWVPSLGQEDPWRRKWQHIPPFLPGKNPMDKRAWQAIVQRVSRVRHDLITKQNKAKKKTLSLFRDDIIIYGENLMKFSKKATGNAK